MNKNREELIEVLNAVSIVSKHLAESLTRLTEAEAMENYDKIIFDSFFESNPCDDKCIGGKSQ